MLISRKETGDTVVEVAIAFAVFSLLAVGASMIMNRGMTSAQESLETTLVRQQMDGQAETLRYLHQEYIAEYPNITSPVASTFRDILDNRATDADASPFGDVECLEDIPDLKNPFLVRPDSPEDIITKTNDKLQAISAGGPAGYAIREGDTSYGLWIEAVKGDDAAVGTGALFYDFHIRACWYGLTSDKPRTLGTIVRLYVPGA